MQTKWHIFFLLLVNLAIPQPKVDLNKIPGLTFDLVKEEVNAEKVIVLHLLDPILQYAVYG
jgi:hypothetical protein